MRAIVWWQATALLLCALPLTASAFTVRLTSRGAPVRWGRLPIRFDLQQQGSADVPDGSDLDALRAAFNAWSATGCRALPIVEVGGGRNREVLAAGGPANGRNELTWIEDATWPWGAYVVAITVPTVDGATGFIDEADVAFNGYHFQWSVHGGDGSFGVWGVGLHEIGHFLGLQHVLDPHPPNLPSPVMAPIGSPYEHVARLGQDERFGMCFLYPAGEAATCFEHGQCPFILDNDAQGAETYVLKWSCQQGRCGAGDLPGMGRRIDGEPCDQTKDCADGLVCASGPLGGATCRNLHGPGQPSGSGPGGSGADGGRSSVSTDATSPPGVAEAGNATGEVGGSRQEVGPAGGGCAAGDPSPGRHVVLVLWILLILAASARLRRRDPAA